MTKHIGIVACSAEGAALCYRTICAEGAALLGGHRHPEVSMHTPPLSSYVQCLEAGNIEGVAQIMLMSATKLRSCGAELLVCPDNTIHQAFGLVMKHSPLPWLHIAEVVAAEAASRGLRRLGIMGTHWLTASRVYPDALAARGIGSLPPEPQDAARLGRIIMDELVPGRINQQSVRWMEGLTKKMAVAGCDGLVLGCTELPLVLGDGNSALPTLDSTRLLARAALRAAA